MSQNILPWAILFGVVLVALAIKGYAPIGLPGLTPKPAPAPPPPGLYPPGSESLGIAFALAKRREAEEELAAEFARKASEELKAAFKSPFSGGPGAPPAPPAPPAAP